MPVKRTNPLQGKLYCGIEQSNTCKVTLMSKLKDWRKFKVLCMSVCLYECTFMLVYPSTKILLGMLFLFQIVALGQKCLSDSCITIFIPIIKLKHLNESVLTWMCVFS